jgi:3-phenylpropionate/cinnamic acid dioxygenase small subunit
MKKVSQYVFADNFACLIRGRGANVYQFPSGGKVMNILNKMFGCISRTVARTSAILALAAILCLSVSSVMAWELTAAQKGLPGLGKHDMVEADYSGKVNTDIQYIADRQAIVTLVTSYAFLIDEGRWDQWFAMFSEDISFETTVPCFGNLVATGKPAMKAFVNERYPVEKPSTTMRRHFMGNVHVAEQTATTAEVRTFMLITKAAPNGDFSSATSGTYNGRLEKRKGNWIVTRWYIEVDTPVRVSAIPKGQKGALKFTPDSSCKKDPVI